MIPLLGILILAPSLKSESAAEFVGRFIKASNAGAIHSPAANLVTEEAASLPDSLGQFLAKPDKVISISSREAVARVEPAKPGSAPNDVYLFVAKNGSHWQVSALRLLALSGIPEQVYEELAKKPKRTRKEEGEFQNLRLVLSTDKELHRYFSAKKAAFERLALGAQKKGASVKTLVESLHVTSAEYSSGIVSISVGGVLDNEVGFMKVTKGKPPQISSNEYIWVEPIAPGWYFYKTT